MPDEPVTDETQGGPPIEEGHPEAGAAFETAAQAHDTLAGILRDDRQQMDPRPYPTAVETEAAIQQIREVRPQIRQWINPITGMWETEPDPQETPSQPESSSTLETKLEDIELTVKWENHSKFCQNPDRADRLVITKHIVHGFCKLDSAGRKRWVKSIGSAQRFEVGSRFIQKGFTWGDSLIELLLIKETPQVPGCKLTDWFDGGFITLMNDAPNNAVMRAHMMRVLKIEPARELDTFEKLKDWVEKTFPKPRKNRHKARDLGNLIPLPPGPPQPHIEIQYRINETEHGRCRYSVEKTGNTVLKLTIDMIRIGIDQGDITDLDDLAEFAMNEAREADEIDWDRGNTETRDCEPDDSEGFNIRLRTDFPTEQVIAMLRQNAPELLEQIGL